MSRYWYDRELDNYIDELFTEAEHQGLSLRDLTNASGLSYTTIYKLSRYERRYPRLETILCIAKAVKMEFNFGYFDKPKLRIVN